ncbi:MAG: metal ABC transporter permease [Planctomycetota bacterium]|nr:metal ABC transporter permease [Planctomycetota bacterium]
MTHPALSMLAEELLSAEMFRAAVVLCAVGVAGAVLSVFVVLRRWAYLGEGISHAGFSGVGTALLISVAIPSLNNQTSIFLIAATFAMATALAVAWISRGRGVTGDTAIGIFVAAALAWGFIALDIHAHLGRGSSGSSGWENYLLGDIRRLTPAGAMLGVGFSVAIVLTMLVLRREMTLYCFDPMLAEVTGVAVGFVHYLLISLVGLVIVIGMQLVGNLLIPALLVLPGATGLALSRNMRVVIATAVAASLLATLGGLMTTHYWRFLQPGPAITMVLFLEFLLAHGFQSLMRRDTC